MPNDPMLAMLSQMSPGGLPGGAGGGMPGAAMGGMPGGGGGGQEELLQQLMAMSQQMGISFEDLLAMLAQGGGGMPGGGMPGMPGGAGLAPPPQPPMPMGLQ